MWMGKSKKKKDKTKNRRGRLKKGEKREPKEPKRLEKQLAGMSLEEMIADLPKKCDWGAKLNAQGKYDVRVKGHIKTFAHLMFGVLALTVEQLLRFVQ